MTKVISEQALSSHLVCICGSQAYRSLVGPSLRDGVVHGGLCTYALLRVPGVSCARSPLVGCIRYTVSCKFSFSYLQFTFYYK